MKVRTFISDDLDLIRELHEKYYGELAFPDFLNLLNGFIIEDDNGEIIMAGGVEHTAEAVLVTNKDKSRIKIGKALVEAQRIAMFTCKAFDIKELYAFTDNDEYANHLIRHGFSKRMRAVGIRISDG